MLELYLAYHSASGWWNAGGDFTPEDFLSLTLYYEFASLPDNAVAPFEEAAARKVWWWCEETGCRNSYAAILNYIGTREVMLKRHPYAKNSGKLAGHTLFHPAWDFETAGSMAHEALYPADPDWKSGRVGYNVPWDWGNLSMFPESAWKPMKESEASLNVNAVVYFYGQLDEQGSAFVIVTFNQEQYWKNYP